MCMHVYVHTCACECVCTCACNGVDYVIMPIIIYSCGNEEEDFGCVHQTFSVCVCSCV